MSSEVKQRRVARGSAFLLGSFEDPPHETVTPRSQHLAPSGEANPHQRAKITRPTAPSGRLLADDVDVADRAIGDGRLEAQPQRVGGREALRLDGLERARVRGRVERDQRRAIALLQIEARVTNAGAAAEILR